MILIISTGQGRQILYPLTEIRIPNIEPYEMAIHGKRDSVISENLIVNGIWEPYETKVITNLIKPDDIIYDIGANIGYYTILFSKLASGNGKVYAFEPEDKNFKLLKFNTKKNNCPNVINIEKGISNITGNARIYLHADNLGAHQIFKSSEKKKGSNIKLIRLDDFSENGNERIDFIKIDTEGAEFRVFEGMKSNILKNKAHIKVIFEFWPNGLDMAGDGIEGLLSLIESFFSDYIVINESDNSLHKITIEHLKTLAEGPLREKRNNQLNILCFGSTSTYETFMHS